jgi:hypothetical protein
VAPWPPAAISAVPYKDAKEKKKKKKKEKKEKERPKPVWVT